jgi:hypothetical protein
MVIGSVPDWQVAQLMGASGCMWILLVHRGRHPAPLQDLQMKNRFQACYGLIQDCDDQQFNFAKFVVASNSKLRSSQRLIDQGRQLIADTKAVIARLQEFS